MNFIPLTNLRALCDELKLFSLVRIKVILHWKGPPEKLPKRTGQAQSVLALPFNLFLSA